MTNLLNTVPYKEFKKNPLSEMIRDYIKHINTSKLIIEENNKFFFIKVQNPQLLRLYGLLKIHQPGNSMRSIVSNINAPTYNLAKFLFRTFSKLKKFDSLSVSILSVTQL